MVLFAVSTHLGPNSFQFTKATHRAIPFVDLADDVDQPNTYQARFQSSLVGLSVTQMGEAKAKAARRVRNRPPNVTTKMSDLAGKYSLTFPKCLPLDLTNICAVTQTNGRIKSWPWSNNKTRLAEKGFQLVTDPRLRTPVEMITTPSRSLKVDFIHSLLLDLDDGYINIVPLHPATPSGAPDQSPAEGSHRGTVTSD
jgi:hypothetical protein